MDRLENGPRGDEGGVVEYTAEEDFAALDALPADVRQLIVENPHKFFAGSILKEYQEFRGLGGGHMDFVIQMRMVLAHHAHVMRGKLLVDLEEFRQEQAVKRRVDVDAVYRRACYGRGTVQR